MNVYDFDNTIYDGESCVDFFCFCLKKDKKLLKYVPNIFVSVILYKLKLLSFEKLYTATAKISSYFIKNRAKLDVTVKEFWKAYQKNLKPEIIASITDKDVVATASPDFLIDGVRPYLPTANILCSRFDLEQGQFKFVCYKQNKVKILKKEFPNTKVQSFYTDSLNDTPLIDYSEEAYLVKKDKIIKIKSKQ